MGKKQKTKNALQPIVPQTITFTWVDPNPIPLAILDLWLSYLKENIMSKRNSKANSWAWHRLYLHSQPNLIQQHVLSLPTQFQTLASTEGSVSPRDERWKTVKPVVSINKIHDNVIDGWYAAIGGMNVQVEGYVSQ